MKIREQVGCLVVQSSNVGFWMVFEGFIGGRQGFQLLDGCGGGLWDVG